MELKLPNLSQDAKNICINFLDLNLNATILQALLHGESIPPFLSRLAFTSSSRRSVYWHCSGNLMDHVYVDCLEQILTFAEV